MTTPLTGVGIPGAGAASPPTASLDSSGAARTGPMAPAPTLDRDLCLVAPALTGGRALVLAPVAPATWRAVSQAVTGFPLLLAAGIVVMVVVPLAFGLAVLGVGIPMCAVLLAVARPAARVERARLRAHLGVGIEEPAYAGASGDGRFASWRALLTDRRRWAHLGYAPTAMGVTVLQFVVVASGGYALALLAVPTYRSETTLSATSAEMLSVVGVAGVWLVALATQALALLHVRVARRCLGPSGTDAAVLAARAEARVAQDRAVHAEDRALHLDQTRTRAVGAADDDRRRIERDLHDGAQQRLVALGVELGTARRAASTDPEAAAAALDHAHREVKETLAELRDLVRGIHPAVLTDRGLDAALSALAARCPIPVDVQVTGSLTAAGPAAQAAAYFVTAEALTNVARHAGASRARVTAVVVADRLCLEVIDDGRGDADARPGSGLDGLRSRVEVLDGSFVLDSPVGRGTRIAVEVPCAS